MRLNKSKKGISLIVLVITIVVMIILATTIILTLSGSDIRGKANEAASASDLSSAKEVASVAISEWELYEEELKAEGYETLIEYANSKLTEAGFGESSETPASLTKDNKVVMGVAALFERKEVPVGTTVTGYDLTEGAETYTTSGKENTASTENEITRDENIAWKYMGIDKNGDVLIVGSVTNTSAKMALEGTGGYLYGPQELDSACKAMYSNNMGIARSMDWEDVTRILEYEGPQGTYYDTDYNEVKTDKALTIGEIETKLGISLLLRTTPDGSAITDFKSDFVNLPKTSTDIKAGDSEKSLVYQTTTYWLASTCACADFLNSGVSFYVRSIDSDNIEGSMVFDSIIANFSASSAVRPVVSLLPSVQMKYENGIVTLK